MAYNLLLYNESIQSLSLSRNGLKATKKVFQYLMSNLNSSLQKLDLSGNSMTMQDLSEMLKCLDCKATMFGERHLCKLRYVDIRQNADMVENLVKKRLDGFYGTDGGKVKHRKLYIQYKIAGVDIERAE